MGNVGNKLIFTALLLSVTFLSGQTSDTGESRRSSGTLKVIFLGTGGGPPPNAQRYGIAILVQAGDEKLLFDCGRGAAIRLTEAGIPLGQVDKVFLTHLHSDHILSVPDLLLTGWAGAGGGRITPFRIWGPEGTRSMMDHMQQAFAYDIHIRRDVDEKGRRREYRSKAPTSMRVSFIGAAE